ncbi:MAG: hypothetical protein OEZ13_12265 [Spirochaetia bacterium]|nr:hypothetical protein [Spirochaetia bacterium]
MAERKYLKIKTPKDIELKKVSLANINNRYVDEEGNRYATRFNLRTRKIDIIRIALGIDEALEAKNKGKLNIEHLTPENEPEGQAKVPEKARWKIPDWLVKENVEPASGIEFQGFLLALQAEAEKFLERIRGVISNVKNSEMFDKGESGADFVLEIQSYYDREILEPINEVKNLIVEFMRFPKSSEHYLSMVSVKQKKWIDTLNEEDKKHYFEAYFIGTPYIETLEKMFRLLLLIKNSADKLAFQDANPEKKRFLEDALAASDFIKNNIFEESAKILGWKKTAKLF